MPREDAGGLGLGLGLGLDGGGSRARSKQPSSNSRVGASGQGGADQKGPHIDPDKQRDGSSDDSDDRGGGADGFLELTLDQRVHSSCANAYNSLSLWDRVMMVSDLSLTLTLTLTLTLMLTLTLILILNLTLPLIL